MSKDIHYKQCYLVKDGVNQMSWIPEQFAIINKVLKLREGSIWDNGWVVKSVYHNKIKEDLLPDSHTEIKQHRKATGDSLPKK